MIVVLGRPGLGPLVADGSRPLDGLAARVALEVVRQGAQVQLAGAVGGDATGDAVAAALGGARVGHAALLRDPAGVTPGSVTSGPPPRLDAGDVGLALSYVPECHVLVVADDLDDAAAASAMDAAAYHGAPVIVVVGAGSPVPDAWERGATVLSAPAAGGSAAASDDPIDPAPFARLVAGFALGLAEGRPASEALSRAVGGAGWERTADA